MPLSSPRFRWSARLQQVERNSPAMRSGERGQPVRLIQQALINLGISPLTSSVSKYGSPDGIFGGETKSAVKKYQTSKLLSSDGVIGKNTMQALDTDLPNAGPSLPALPSTSRFTVPGMMVARDQLKLGHSNLCWAYVYAMMVSWKRQQSVDARQLVADVGSSWVALFDSNQALPWVQTTNFYRAAGMRTEPLMSITAEVWAEMLKYHGPLTVHGLHSGLSGGHVRLVYGVQGDGDPKTTMMLILDPWGGQEYGESFERFTAKHEGAASQQGRTTQIGHF